MFVRNDSILIKGYYEDDKDYYITNCISRENEKACWTLKETTRLSSVVFEDDDYKIVYTNNGEWGSYMSFIDDEFSSNLTATISAIMYGSVRLRIPKKGLYINVAVIILMPMLLILKQFFAIMQ